MPVSARAKEIIAEFANDEAKLGDLKKLAARIKKDHELSLELWASEKYFPRLLSVLILDKKLLTLGDIEKFASDMLLHNEDQRSQLADWLLANQLMKDKKLISLIERWEDHPSPILRRLFWYHQARLRWTGKAPPDNSEGLLFSLENHMASAEPPVQWAMNFCAGQIGIHEPKYRIRCIALGKTFGLYKDEVVPKKNFRTCSSEEQFFDNLSLFLA